MREGLPFFHVFLFIRWIVCDSIMKNLIGYVIMKEKNRARHRKEG